MGRKRNQGASLSQKFTSYKVYSRKEKMASRTRMEAAALEMPVGDFLGMSVLREIADRLGASCVNLVRNR